MLNSHGSLMQCVIRWLCSLERHGLFFWKICVANSATGPQRKTSEQLPTILYVLQLLCHSLAHFFVRSKSSPLSWAFSPPFPIMDDLLAMLQTNDDPEGTQTITISPQHFQNNNNNNNNGNLAAAVNEIATALQRNHHIETFHSRGCGSDLLCPILRGLASPDSACRIRTMKYDAPDNVGDEESNLLAEALRDFLASRTGATVQCLEMRNVEFALHAGSYKIVEGLYQNESITELTFAQCCIGRFHIAWDELDVEDESELEALMEQEGIDMTHQAEILAGFLEDRSNLTTLRILEGCNFLDSGECNLIVEAVHDILKPRGPSLQCFDMDTESVPVTDFRELLEAASRCSHLECLTIRNVGRGRLEALEATIPPLKVKELVVTVLEEDWNQDEEDRLLEAFKRNYAVQSIECMLADDEESNWYWFTPANQDRLDVFLDRNHKLVQWTNNPKMVPRELWSYAMMLALKAGVDPLFQSLVALSGKGVGLRGLGRKRKRTQFYDPSSYK